MQVETPQSGLNSVGQYDLLSKIAEGGMGAVYRARNRVTGELVAIKVVPPHLLNNQVFLKRFEQEYTVAKGLSHPNIVKALDFGREGTSPYLVMEFVEGESLGQRLDRERQLSERDAIGIITQVAANDLTVLKIMPPLCIGRPAIDRLAAALDTVLADKGMLGALVDLAKSTVAK